MTQQRWGQQWGQSPRQQSAPPWASRAGQTQGGRQGQSGSPWYQPLPPGFSAPRPRQPYYAPGQFSPPPPRRRHPLGRLLLSLIGVALLAFIGLTATSLLSPTSDVAYQNDDYQVPPPDKNPPALPLPETYADAEQFVVQNTFYDQSVTPPVRCNALPINVATADDAQLKSHFETLMECTVRVWEPPITKAGFQIVRPTVTIFGREITTKCGRSEVNAFYCSADQQVYFSNLLPDYVTIVKRDKWAADVVMAHEFGHALQARTGILISANALGQNSGSDATELELSRRLETQADCFAGMFTHTVAQSLNIQPSDSEGIEATFAAVGDDAVSGKANIVGNHGLAASRRYWGTVGLGSDDVGRCNTFTAKSSLVR